jgi:hypothetical protein
VFLDQIDVFSFLSLTVTTIRKYIMLKIIVLLSSFIFPVMVSADLPVLFKPPVSGAPATQMGGGTRGIKNTSVNMELLAPEQVALTAQASPNLYWYISALPHHNIEFSLSLEDTGETIFEQTLPAVTKEGIQSIQLSTLNVQLKEGEQYRWSIALIVDPNQRVNDVIASATFRRESTAIPLNDVAKLAQAGYWYDTVQYLAEQKSPQMTDLLKQQGITLGK